ncbi:Alpha-protein kinase vwkA [Tetrabaena socialis]|uniref:Alpha-protein kinase vwkA n=1 Tax=Tetrabaena socialis TaxID=47790 RepID=A0A2J7ZPW1_9CHLO|nr:Alpha-protein kinase vwkA [Tetrabaena socialis]|eukprot:PNH02305.1 Alpha-protein kinase vwkA [Tetrabaena socialis]
MAELAERPRPSDSSLLSLVRYRLDTAAQKTQQQALMEQQKRFGEGVKKQTEGVHEQEKEKEAHKVMAHTTAEEEVARKKRLEPFKIQIRAAMKMDLVFIIDITRSMQTYWDAVVKQVNCIIESIEVMYKDAKSNFRIGFVGYRDVCDIASHRYMVRPLEGVEGSVSSVTRKWLESVLCCGGGDTAEDVHGALEKAGSAEMLWGRDPMMTRTVVHIADAPGHGARLHQGLESAKSEKFDKLPDHDKDGKELERLLRHLRETVKVQKYMFIHVRHKRTGLLRTVPMVEQFSAACGDISWIKESEWDGEERLVLDAVRLKSMARHDMASVCSISGLMDMIRAGHHIRTVLKEVSDAACIKIAPSPFAAGSTQLAFHGRFFPDGVDKEGLDVVLKEFRSGSGADNTALQYEAQMEVHSVASFLAGQFNLHAEEQGLEIPEVRYTECDMVCVAQPNSSPDDLDRFLLMEPLLTGEMRKYNNSMGVVNPLDPQPHLQAFSHWSYRVTEHMLMIVDLQGFKIPSQQGSSMPAKILLVDPAIHCIKEDFFYKTSIGGRPEDGLGFDLFIKSHDCGEYCNKLIPTCKAFRLRHETAKDARPQTPTTPPPIPPRPSGENFGPTDPLGKTSEFVREKLQLLKTATKAHEECALLLAAQGVPKHLYENLHDAITQCVKRRLLTRDRAALLHSCRELGNDGRHDWSEVEAMFNVPGGRVQPAEVGIQGGGNRDGGGRKQGGGRGVNQGGNRGGGRQGQRGGKQRK